MYGRQSLLGGLSNLSIPLKRKVFVSYHHGGDQLYFDHFTSVFGETYQIFQDRSLGERIRSEDPEYVNRKIREDYIVGSSITIVLCGAETWKRKYVDWEIFSTLHHKHALLGIILPTAIKNYQGQIIVPDRLADNINTGFARWMHWDWSWSVNPQELKNAIETTVQQCNPSLILNSRLRMTRNSA
jgi:hypothetical protein